MKKDFKPTESAGGNLPMQAVRYLSLSLFLIISFFSTPALAGHGAGGGPPKATIEDGDTVNVSGIILDSHKEPVGEASVEVFMNGKEVDKVVTAHNGKYVSRFQVEKDKVTGSTINVKASKASFKTNGIEFKGVELAKSGDHFYISEDISLDRFLGPAFWISTIIFILAYVLIAFELLHRTVAAMLGGAVMLVISYTIGTINPEYHIFSLRAPSIPSI